MNRLSSRGFVRSFLDFLKGLRFKVDEMIKRADLIKEWCRKIRKARREVDLGESIGAALWDARGVVLAGGEDDAFFCAGEEVRGGRFGKLGEEQ